MSRVFLISLLSLFLSHANAQLQTEPADTGAVREVSLSHLQQDGKTMIALTFGQSNAGNYGQRAYTPRNANVYNYYKGKLYTAKDPLFGATRSVGGGSVWSQLGDMLIDSGLYSKVIIIPIAVGGSSIERWATGDCFDKLQQTLNYLDSQHIRLTHIFWHQGETDNILNTSTAKYKEQLGAILQTIRKTQSADLYISLASFYSGSVTKPLGIDSAIRKAQQEFINENKTVLEGPDTDTLIHAIHRYDSVHFSDFGIKAFARLWLQAIKKKNEKCHL
ncbi:sialate O-acetylesterase [Terrimonas pollutisoli]|uniref:sialate O-acetylesterase n=1 Tax=Terrimonas pollutisoli TaxID=3034147 RepID=UPI0023EB3F01|nr:sialate O-acetylesterase [Terrimonas sp. H1YJ31]